MSENTASLRRKLDSANKLHAVVRAMKALAASNIGQFEKSILALADYSRTVEMGLGVCLRQNIALERSEVGIKSQGVHKVVSIVFGSDQGLVGQFNNKVGDFAMNVLQDMLGNSQIWAVGERSHLYLSDVGRTPQEYFAVPGSIGIISKLIEKILSALEKLGSNVELYLFYNQATSNASYQPIQKRVLPLDERWSRKLSEAPWPTKLLPESMGSKTLSSLVRDYIFISLFRACAESLAAENASRLSAMQRADKNIEELVENMGQKFNNLRQSRIDEELFDVISAFGAPK